MGPLTAAPADDDIEPADPTGTTKNSTTSTDSVPEGGVDTTIDLTSTTTDVPVDSLVDRDDDPSPRWPPTTRPSAPVDPRRPRPAAGAGPRSRQPPGARPGTGCASTSAGPGPAPARRRPHLADHRTTGSGRSRADYGCATTGDHGPRPPGHAAADDRSLPPRLTATTAPPPPPTTAPPPPPTTSPS